MIKIWTHSSLRMPETAQIRHCPKAALRRRYDLQRIRLAQKLLGGRRSPIRFVRSIIMEKYM